MSGGIMEGKMQEVMEGSMNLYETMCKDLADKDRLIKSLSAALYAIGQSEGNIF